MKIYSLMHLSEANDEIEWGKFKCVKCLEEWSIKNIGDRVVNFCPFCGQKMAIVAIRNNSKDKNRFIGSDKKGNYIYVGETDTDGIPNGKGELTYASGEKYIGTFSNGRLTGKGKWILISGKTFEGMFEDGKQVEGDGILEDTNGDIYTGYFRKGLRMHGIVNVTRKGWKKSTRIEYENGHKKRAL